MSDARPAKDLDKIMIRLPDGMRERLTELAKGNKRSVNAEVVARLEASLEREPRFASNSGPKSEAAERKTGQVIDLMEALRATIDKLEILKQDIK